MRQSDCLEVHPYLPRPILEIDNQQGDYAFMEKFQIGKTKTDKAQEWKNCLLCLNELKLLKKNSLRVVEVIDTPLRGTVVKSDSRGDLPTL